MPKILFVEDDPFISEIYMKKFESSGFEAVNAATGKAALKEAMSQKFDIMLLDLVLPEMGGKDILREIRSNQEYPRDLKIVIFSNLSSAEDREECLKLGANGFISKTEFSPSQVVEEINRFLRQFNEQGKNHSRQTSEVSVESKETGKKILFIEDEPVFVDMFSRRLRDEGYEVVAETNGVSGLDTAMNNHFDLIISDVSMPGMKGDEAIRRLKEIEGKESVPIFFLSASLESDTLKGFVESGLSDKAFLKTQVTPSELVYAVNEFFEEREKKK